MRKRVIIIGGGVAGLEALLALRALGGDRLDISIVAPELKFINQSMCVEQPFKPQRVRGIRLDRVAADFDAHWYQDELTRVAPEERYVVTKTGECLRYDRLVLATGARLQPDYSDSLTYRDGRDGPNYRLLLRHLLERRVNRLAFVKPSGPSWPLPLYDLALMTAAHCAAHDRSGLELSLVTPEEEPLGAFGKEVSDAIRRLLSMSGVTLYTSSYAVASQPGWLDISPGNRAIPVDRIVNEPRLVGRRVPGIPLDHDGFIPTDAHGRVLGLENVFAAGDASSFPIKQGGLAAQQADAVAEAIAASVGLDIEPRTFHPVLRGVLLTGGPPRFLAPYISSQTGSALDVQAPNGEHAIPIESPLLHELSELRETFSTSAARETAVTAAGRRSGGSNHGHRPSHPRLPCARPAAPARPRA